ncbi:fungal peroxidase [Mycena latifolia]|nr:fungal peroxidase [Mycena latifolia]
MKLNLVPALTSLSLFAGLVSSRKTSLLINNPALPDLPTVHVAQAAASASGLNLDDIQGDILIGMKKNKELFFFFGIANATAFKAKLKSDILPLLTTTTQLLPNNTAAQPVTALNIAFSQTGLFALNVTDSLADTAFANGQAADNGTLGDPGTVNWVPEFVGTSIHGVILFASDTVENVDASFASLKTALGDSINEIYSLQGAARPAPFTGHEHFGFLDGISNPSVDVLQDPNVGQAIVQAGEILVGEAGDPLLSSRPPWAKDGSFLAFRQLKQLVPEFDKFLTDNPIRAPGLTAKNGSDLLGARMVGRWKSGAPVFLSPIFDNPALGADKTRNNNFTYALPGQTQSNLTDSSKCPFSAHIRKTRPRADLGTENTGRHIVRGGIPYGPEVTSDEASSNTTEIERGLAFVAYQSDIGNGFQFLQNVWANNPNFRNPNTGFDALIGANHGGPRVVNGGLDPTDPTRTFTLMTDFIVSRGGEYFFSPSLSAIANTLSV